MRSHLEELIAMLAGIDGLTDLTLTTNGFLLAQKAAVLKAAGLHRLTVSLDSLDPVVFGIMCGRSHHPATVLAGIAAAEAAGFTAIKINCVVQKGTNDHTLVALARHFRGTGHIVRFIEFMDVGTVNGWEVSQVMTAREIARRIDAELPIEPIAANYRGEVARRWRYKDGSGEIGIIASVSEPFCGDCTRARLSTDGKLVTCLFAAGGQDLRALLRDGASDEQLRARIAQIWSGRADRYSEERSAATDLKGSAGSAPGSEPRRKIEMFQIGG